MTKILLIIHSKSLRSALAERLAFENYATSEADSETMAEEMCRTTTFDAAIVGSDIAIERIDIPKIVVTPEPNINSAIAAIRHGAIDYLTLPIDMNQLLGTLRKHTHPVESEEEAPAKSCVRHTPKRTNYATQPIIGRSEAIDEVRRMIQRVAPSDARVLVLGENGTGKELVARWLHLKSNRHEMEIKSIDNEAIDLLEHCNWTGNIRELHNAVERLIILSDDRITADSVKRYCHA